MALPLTLPHGQPTPIGWVGGEPVWPARGARKNGMEFVVDSLDGDDPDEFDADGERDDDEPDDDRSDRRGGQARRRQAAQDPDDDDDEADDGDDADETDDGTDEGDETAAWEPPTKEQWHKVEEALRRNNGENRKMRLTKKVMARLGIKDEQEFTDFLLDRGIDPETGNRLVDLGEDAGSEQGDDAEGDDKARGGERRSKEQVVLERRRAEERGAARVEERYRPALVQFAAAAALAEADYSGKDMAMALRLFDMGDIDVEFDDNGDPVVYGLDDQVEKIKKEFPQLFRRKAAAAAVAVDEPARRRNGRTSNGRTGARSIDGGDRGRTAPAPKGWLAQIDRQITHGR